MSLQFVSLKNFLINMYGMATHTVTSLKWEEKKPSRTQGKSLHEWRNMSSFRVLSVVCRYTTIAASVYSKKPRKEKFAETVNIKTYWDEVKICS